MVTMLSSISSPFRMALATAPLCRALAVAIPRAYLSTKTSNKNPHTSYTFERNFNAVQNRHKVSPEGFNAAPSRYNASSEGLKAALARHTFSEKRLNAAPSRYNASPEDFNAASSKYNASSEGLKAAPTRHTFSKKRLNAAPSRYNDAPGCLNAAPSRCNDAPNGSNATRVGSSKSTTSSMGTKGSGKLRMKNLLPFVKMSSEEPAKPLNPLDLFIEQNYTQVADKIPEAGVKAIKEHLINVWFEAPDELRKEMIEDYDLKMKKFRKQMKEWKKSLTPKDEQIYQARKWMLRSMWSSKPSYRNR